MKTSAALTSLMALLSMRLGVGNVISVTLSGGQQVPDPVTTDVTGTATIELLADGTIEYSVMLLNPSGIELLGEAGAHLHCAARGANGNVVAFLAQPVTGGDITTPVEFSGSISATDIVDDTCGDTIELLYGSIRAGRVYINVHSTENPDGEVRGQIPKVTSVDDAIVVSLSGANEVPPITSSVTGMITIQLFSDGSLEFFANIANPDAKELLGVAGAHIHCGPIDGEGPVVASLAQPITGGDTALQIGFNGFIDITGIVDDTCGATIDLLYESIAAGGTYVNVHSTENPDGEVRGQILVSALMPTSSPNSSPTSAPSASPDFMSRSASVGLAVALVAVAAM
jgi:hypothetical protein